MAKKRKKSATNVEAISVVGEVEGCDVLLVDDITEPAGTLMAAAKILRDSGALRIRAAVSHCIFNDLAIERLKSGIIDELITTNSVPIDTHGLPSRGPRRASRASLGPRAIQRINTNESVTGLFRIKGF